MCKTTNDKHGRAVAVLLTVSTAILWSPFTQACSSCGCTLNSDWSSQGYTVSSGLRLDLRSDYYDQNQLRSGTSSVDRASLDIPNEQEIQQRTLNRNTTIGFDYSPSRLWGIRVEVPYFDRFHTTIPEDEVDIATSHSEGIGDVRLSARYQGFSPDLSWGVLFGVKLPTGATDVTFASGPSQGEPVDRGLQPGTGTTDVLLGVYNFGNLGSRFGYYTQMSLQQPVNTHNGFKPGAGLNLDAGLRYLHADKVVPQLQVNLHAEGRESGINADRDNSGATFVYVSPGITVKLNTHLQVFGFLQIPAYQRVNGLQLLPGRFFSVGTHYSF